MPGVSVESVVLERADFGVFLGLGGIRAHQSAPPTVKASPQPLRIMDDAKQRANGPKRRSGVRAGTIHSPMPPHVS